jgi:homoserine kinase
MITIKVPATSANLGPGFDALGLAVDLWNESTFELADDFIVYIDGEGKGKIPQGNNSLIIRAAQRLAESVGKDLPRFTVRCVNHIPPGSGLGSSAAAVLTGLLAANTFTGFPLKNDEILKLATQIEGHPDNVAPALLGGLVVSTRSEGTIITRKLPIAPLLITVVVPDFRFPTRQARKALPHHVKIKDAVHNIGRAMLAADAFRTGDIALLANAMDDALHQPYRLPLIPGAQAAMSAAKMEGAAVALSGAGPSLIAFSSQENPGIGESMKRAFQSAGLQARVFPLKVCHEGIVIVSH